MEGKGPVALAMRFLFVLQGDRSYYDLLLANNLHVREDKAATARKTCGKPKPHREFRRDYFRGGNAPASLKPSLILFQGPSPLNTIISGVETPRPH